MFTFVRFEIGSVYTITVGLPWKFLNFNGVLHRCPSITQANSQVCFEWISVIEIAWREFEAIPHVKYCRRKLETNLSFCYTEKKMDKFDFSTFATKLRFCSIFPDRRS